MRIYIFRSTKNDILNIALQLYSYGVFMLCKLTSSKAQT